LLDNIIAKHTGQDVAKVKGDTDRDYILTADRALEYGVIDEILTSRGSKAGLTAADSNGA
jgi:ATP-dependent Clp protease protease subunit